MKKLIIILCLIIAVFLGCEWVEKDGIKPIYDYDFQNDIQINTIDEALIWIHNNIRYKSENKDYAQTPEETYLLKTGDCEDFAIIFAYLLYNKLDLKDVEVVIAEYHAFNYLPSEEQYYEPQAYKINDSTAESYNIIGYLTFPEIMGKLL